MEALSEAKKCQKEGGPLFDRGLRRRASVLVVLGLQLLELFGDRFCRHCQLKDETAKEAFHSLFSWIIEVEKVVSNIQIPGSAGGLHDFVNDCRGQNRLAGSSY